MFKFISKLKKYWRKQEIKGIIEKSYFTQFLPPNPVILEAGAHIGIDTLAMAKEWKNATIHAFEPESQLFRKLQKNTEGIPSIHIYPLALADKTDEVDFYISSGQSDGSSSILKPKKHLDIHPQVIFEDKKSVQAITLDDWSMQNGITKVDMLWLDLQGYELPVLKNSLSILRGVNVIYTEVNLIENYENNALYNELKIWLQEQGFVVEREELAWHDAGNVLFIKK